MLYGHVEPFHITAPSPTSISSPGVTHIFWHCPVVGEHACQEWGNRGRTSLAMSCCVWLDSQSRLETCGMPSRLHFH